MRCAFRICERSGKGAKNIEKIYEKDNFLDKFKKCKRGSVFVHNGKEWVLENLDHLIRDSVKREPFAKGSNGKDGKDGRRGELGFEGATGPQGPRGFPGLDGKDGEIGPRGFPGLDGKDGRDGLDGIDGLPGEIGPRGYDGKEGPRGRDGKDGEIGPRGFPGLDGIDGLPGEIGPRGYDGPIGPPGLDGKEGPPGPIGLQGPIGKVSDEIIQNVLGETLSVHKENKTATVGHNTTKDGVYNTVFGVYSENSPMAGNYNLHAGTDAGRKNAGSGNLFLGPLSGADAENVWWSTIIGANAGRGIITGLNTTIVGANSGAKTDTTSNPENSLCIGTNSFFAGESPKNQTIIGNDLVSYGDNTITLPSNLTSFPNGCEANFSSTGGGCLYPVSSSIRWKHDIHDIDEIMDTERVYDLRPVTYKSRNGGDVNELNIGLLAEETSAIFPELTCKDTQNRPSSVKYSLLAVLLLAQLKKIKQRLDEVEKSKLNFNNPTLD